jgi:hypothetical protein
MRLDSLSLVAAFAALSLTAGAQAVPAASLYGVGPGRTPFFELGLQYEATHVNAPPSACGCFWMQGGGMQLAYPVDARWAVAADLSGANAADVNGLKQRLSTFNYVFGPRFSLRSYRALTPYAQAMAGASEVFSNYAIYGHGRTYFAAMGGDGLELRLSHHLSLVPLEANYIYSRADNGVNQHQNSLRIAAGINLRVGGR